MTNTTAILFTLAAIILTFVGVRGMLRESRVKERQEAEKIRQAKAARQRLLDKQKEDKKQKLAACEAFFMLLGLPEKLLSEQPVIMWVDIHVTKHNSVVKFLYDAGFEVFSATDNASGIQDYAIYFCMSHEKDFLFNRMKYLTESLSPATYLP